MLKGYCEALAEEYKNNEQGEDWTTLWLNNVPEGDFAEAGIDREFFKKWCGARAEVVEPRSTPARAHSAPGHPPLSCCTGARVLSAGTT